MAKIRNMFARDSNQLTQTGEHRMFSIRRGHPVQRFLLERGSKTPFFFASIGKPHHVVGFAMDANKRVLPWSAERQIDEKYRA